MTDPPIPYTNPDSVGASPSASCTETQKNKTPRTSRKKELTPVEEVEEFLRMEAAKERAARNKKLTIPYLFHLLILSVFNVHSSK